MTTNQTNDEKIFDFLYDLKNIESMSEDYSSLKDFKKECTDILTNKEFSSINIQDEKGNTFLHYAFIHMNLNMINTLLNMGADPSIKNKNRDNCFQNSKYGEVYKFWKQYDTLYFNKSYHDKTKDYCDNFKQILFDNLFEKQMTQFKKTEEIEIFLKDNKVYKDENKLNLLMVSLMIEQDEKLNYFLKNFNTPAQNSLMLWAILRCYQVFSIHPLEDENQAEDFLSRNFEINNEFISAASKIIKINKDNLVLRKIFDVLIKEDFFIQSNPNRLFLNVISLKEELEKSLVSKSVYQFLKLEKNMPLKIDKQKKLKI